MLQYKTLSNGVLMPYIGLGTWTLKDQVCRSSVKSALSANYELIDTASVYKNEECIRAELDAYTPPPHSKKLETGNGKGIFITSKANTNEMGSKETYDACLQSMKRLGVPQLDLYLLHWPGASKVCPDDLEQRKIRLESWRAMERLYKEKKVRAIGVSNYLVRHLQMLLEDGVEVVPHVNQLELHPECPNRDVLDFCKQHKIAVQAYSSLGSGDVKLIHHPVVVSVAKAEKKEPTQVLLRWALEQDIMIIPRSTRCEHIVENLKLGGNDMALTKESMTSLNSICQIDCNAKRRCWDPTKVA